MKKNRIVLCAAAAAVVLSSGALPVNASENESVMQAVYLGVEDYGAPQTNRDHMDNFRYRFEIDGKETVLGVSNGEKDAEDMYDYPVQNVLKEGYSYMITVDEDTVTCAEEIADGQNAVSPLVSGVPGERTLENFLRTALMPIGKTLYIYGGGWNWQDTGSGKQTRTLGVSPDWVRFFDEQDENYTYKVPADGDKAPPACYYPYGGYNEYYYAGLDCSGYLGWVIYNTFETENGQEGYVGAAAGFAKRLADTGRGTWTQTVSAQDEAGGTQMKPGDIMSLKGHVWICLGTCDDGSLVILHSTPSCSRTGQPGGGVQIGAIGDDENCEAYFLADRYMSALSPEWYARYPAALKEPAAYFSIEGDSAGMFSWDVTGTSRGLTDPAGIRQMDAEDILKMLTGI